MVRRKHTWPSPFLNLSFFFPVIKKKPDEESLDEKNIAEPLESDEKESETEDIEGKENDKVKDLEGPLNQSNKTRGSRRAASAAREKFKDYKDQMRSCLLKL